MGLWKRWIWGYGGTVLCMLGLVLWADQTVTTMAWEESRHCIVVDAGHGGEDGGASSCTGKLESEYNLEISLRLAQVFHLLGYDTKMIRTTDTSVYTKGETLAQKKVSDLKERVRIVNSMPNSVLVSIHQNTFSDARYSGAQVFYGAGQGSEALAKQLQENLVKTLNPGSNRACKPAQGIYLMEHAERPGVLVECGFLSNAQEEAQLSDPEYQKKLSAVIALTIAGYLSNT